MNVDEKVQQPGKRRVIHTTIAMVLIVVAVALLIYMITVEGELGALPLLLLVSGIIWLVVARFRMRPRED